jgi:hypothetical protein
VNAIAKNDLSPFYVYGFIILILIIADIISKGNPARMLMLFSVLGIIALFTGMATDGLISVYAFTSVGLFCSTLWPCIFTLAISGLGKHTSQGSSFLIMMIMGGGIISWLQGFVADNTNIHFSYIIGVICFAYLAFYAIVVTKILKKPEFKNIDFKKLNSRKQNLPFIYEITKLISNKTKLETQLPTQKEKEPLTTGYEVVSFDPFTGQLIVSREFDDFTGFNMFSQPDKPAVGPLGGGLKVEAGGMGGMGGMGGYDSGGESSGGLGGPGLVGGKG